MAASQTPPRRPPPGREPLTPGALQVDPAWLEIIERRSSYSLMLRWAPLDFSVLVSQLALAVLAVVALGPDVRRLIVAVLVVALGGLVVSLLGRGRTSLALEELALFDLPARLARVLLKMADDYGRPATGSGVRIDMKLSQRALSTLVASTRESVNKQMQAWRKDGVVDMDAGYIVLRRADDLQMLVE